MVVSFEPLRDTVDLARSEHNLTVELDGQTNRSGVWRVDLDKHEVERSGTQETV